MTSSDHNQPDTDAFFKKPPVVINLDNGKSRARIRSEAKYGLRKQRRKK